VGIWESIGGYVNIEAATEAEAWDIAQATLDEHGIAGFPGFDITHRECNIVDCEEEPA
jgi:hypothetical protein